METKKCVACPEDKPITDFSWKSEPKGIRQSKCKTCYRKLRNKWYEKNKDKEVKTVLAYRKKQRAKLKEWLSNYKQNLSCEVCPENRPQCLQFHHKDPKQKDLNIAQVVSAVWPIERVLNEINKCQVLCANCHLITHYKLRLLKNSV